MTVLLTASTGGHLAQLHRMRRHLPLDGADVVWLTFDTPQSRSLLAAEHVHFLHYTAPRDWRNVLRNTAQVPGLVRRHGVERAYSTGSGIALSVLPLASRMGVQCHYIESAARSTGPSVTGHALALVPGVRTYTQYDAWASPRWRKAVSVFDDFVPVAAPQQAPPVRRVVVMLGTIARYSFRGLVERLLEVLPADVEVLWQTGETDTTGLGVDGRAMLPHAELRAAIAQADVVVSHSGIGSALDVLEAGKVPLLVPRRPFRGEHVDDHQVLIARELHARGLAVHRELPELTWQDLRDVAGRTVSTAVLDA